MGAGLSAVMPTSPLGAGLFLGRKCQGRGLPSALCQGGWKDGLGHGGEVRGRGIFRLLPSGELLSLIPSDLFLRFTKSLPFPGSLWGLGRPQWPLSFRNFLWLSSLCCFLAWVVFALIICCPQPGRQGMDFGQDLGLPLLFDQDTPYPDIWYNLPCAGRGSLKSVPATQSWLFPSNNGSSSRTVTIVAKI